MKVNEVLLRYVNKEKEPRQLGRYWASDLYGMIKGYLTPENFFVVKPVDLVGVKMILTGEAMEEKLNNVFQKERIVYEYQVKKEIKISDEVVLVVRPDFIFKSFILETKFPFTLLKEREIPEKWIYQLEAYYRAFWLPVYLGVMSIPFTIRFTEFCPSKLRWNKMCSILLEFHQKLKQKVGNYKK